MKKIFLIFLLMFPFAIFAKGSLDVSSTNLKIVVGSTKTITINANNSAGKIDISSSNSKIAKVSDSSIFLDMQSKKITISAKSVGSAKITIKATDLTTYDDEDLTGKTYVVNVTVVDKPKTKLSDNVKLKSLSIDKYKLTKVNDTKYTLEVDSDVEKVNIKAVAADSKAKILGNGDYKLDYGNNDMELVITSESGIYSTINISVYRKFEIELKSDTDENENDDNVHKTIIDFNKMSFIDIKENIWLIISSFEFIIILILLFRRNKR